MTQNAQVAKLNTLLNQPILTAVPVTLLAMLVTV
jgi:hypothetical protein